MNGPVSLRWKNGRFAKLKVLQWHLRKLRGCQLMRSQSYSGSEQIIPSKMKRSQVITRRVSKTSIYVGLLQTFNLEAMGSENGISINH